VPKGETTTSALAAAAAALESELSRFEELAETARKIPLTSEKNIDRAARATTEAAARQEAVIAQVQALVAAIGDARQRQQATSEVLLARAQEIQARSEELGEILKRFASLGVEARGINEAVGQLASIDRARIGAELVGIRAKMDGAIDLAQSVAKDALEKELADIARHADQMRQQILAAKNKLGLLEKAADAAAK
jgi:hypothetical protein